MNIKSKFRLAIREKRWADVEELIKSGVKRGAGGFGRDGMHNRLTEITSTCRPSLLTIMFEANENLRSTFPAYSVVEKVWSGKASLENDDDVAEVKREFVNATRICVTNKMDEALNLFFGMIKILEIDADDLSTVFKCVLRSGNMDQVKLLSSFVDLKNNGSQAIVWVISELRLMGSVSDEFYGECLNFLIPLSDPKDFAIMGAEVFSKGHCGNRVFIESDTLDMAERMLSLIPAGSNVTKLASRQIFSGSGKFLDKIIDRKDLFVDFNLSIIDAAIAGNVSALRKLIPLGSDQNLGECEAMYQAARKGHTACVKLLAPNYPHGARGSTPLLDAAYNGHKECVKILLPLSDVRAQEDMILTLCAKQNWSDLASMLLSKGLNPRSHNSGALRMAAYRDNLELVKTLAQFSNANELNCEALRTAISERRLKIIEVLVDHLETAWDRSCALYASVSELSKLFILSARGHTRKELIDTHANILSFLTDKLNLADFAPQIKKIIDDAVSNGGALSHEEIYRQILAFEERREFSELVLAPPPTPRRSSRL